MLRQRLIVAAIGLPLLGVLLAVPEPAFAAVVELVLAVATFELVRSAQPHETASRELAGNPASQPASETDDLVIPIAAAAATALLVAALRVEPDFFPSPWALMPLTAIALALLIRGPNPFSDTLLGWWLGAVLYLGVLGAHFVLLREIPDGQRWLIVLLATVFSTDTGAYAVGRMIGRHKMAPRVSPHKTWEGAAGGYVFGAAAAVIATLALDLDAPVAAIILLAAGGPVVAEIGDLVESALKRRLGVKDVSHLLPGHGGFLDRLDSLLFVGPWLYWILQWVPS